MTRIESEKTAINKPAQELFDFLSDFNNFQKLMPPQVTNWSSTQDSCSFTISGMATVEMRVKEKTPPASLKIESEGKTPFSFNLLVDLEESGSSGCLARLTLEAELNPMLKIMAEKPLTNFVNLLAAKMKEL